MYLASSFTGGWGCNKVGQEFLFVIKKRQISCVFYNINSLEESRLLIEFVAYFLMMWFWSCILGRNAKKWCGIASPCRKDTVGIFEESCQLALGRETLTVKYLSSKLAFALFIIFKNNFSLVMKDPIQIRSIFMRVFSCAPLLLPHFYFHNKTPSLFESI